MCKVKTCKVKTLIPALLFPGLLFFPSCAGKETGIVKSEEPGREQILPVSRTGDTSRSEFSAPLDGIAEVERSGGYYPGLALTESGLREKAGDYAGAVIAAYKELSFNYGYGSLDRKKMDEALAKSFAVFENTAVLEAGERDAVLAAVRGVQAFSAGSWEEAAVLLGGFLSADEEPDSFLHWMLLVCSLESNDAVSQKSKRSSYGAIRARYNSFPEYWYRGARAYREAVSVSSSAGIPAGENIAGIYAEQCINLNPAGPFAGECRSIIAGSLGLSGSGEAIRSKAEIDETIRRSVSTENPELLDALLPLITLPDNSYTAYAVDVLKNLVSVPSFRAYFEKGAGETQGRLAERLRYISRG